MFFEPPKVKSLSRYAEYGAYVGQKHFLLMLAIAFAAHMALIVIYSLVPTEEVLKIPVRVLNIKLSGGSSANGIHMPSAIAMPAAKSTPDASPEAQASMKPVKEENVESAIDDALTVGAKASAERPPAHAATPKGATGKNPNKHIKAITATTAKADQGRGVEFSFSTPKKYIRAGDEDEGDKDAKGKGQGQGAGETTGNGSGMTGEAKGKEIVDRYTQTISLWIQNHKNFAHADPDAIEKNKGLTGVVLVRMRIGHDGHILSNTVEHTSGNELIDQAAMSMVRASDPVPAVPDDYPDKQLEYLIAVTVTL